MCPNEISSLFTKYCKITQYGRNEYGDMIEDYTLETKCHIEPSSKQIIDKKKENKTLTCIIYLADIDLNSDKTYKVEVDNKEINIETIEPVINPITGQIHHWELGGI